MDGEGRNEVTVLEVLCFEGERGGIVEGALDLNEPGLVPFAIAPRVLSSLIKEPKTSEK